MRGGQERFNPRQSNSQCKGLLWRKGGEGEKAREIKEAVDTPTWVVIGEKKKERLNGSHYDSSGISEKRPIRSRCD